MLQARINFADIDKYQILCDISIVKLNNGPIV